jgi:NADPH:quinone reductase-like Zn-dependent oxidoreductase
MKAIICTHYGAPEVLKLAEVEKPKPTSNQVCIKVKATAVTASDIIVRGMKIPIMWRLWMGIALGFRKPRKGILGLTLAGEIESVGEKVTRFKVGDKVYAFTGFGFGAWAEYKCMNENNARMAGAIEHMPSNMSFEEAAAISYSGILATHYTGLGSIEKGHKVLIYGASGSIGTTAVQLAKYYGAEVTAVCGPSNQEMVKSLGADKVVDYTQKHVINKNERYDFVLDAVGKRKSSKLKSFYKKALSAKGQYISVDDGSPKMSHNYLGQIRELIEAGHIKAIIDKCYPLEQIVEANRYVDTGHKKGNVVISVS